MQEKIDDNFDHKTVKTGGIPNKSNRRVAVKSQSDQSEKPGWKPGSKPSETLISDNRLWFRSITHAIDHAKKIIELETYIFAPDRVGNAVFLALLRAARRGVKVRMVVDGFGSLDWLRQVDINLPEHFELRVYHPIPFAGGRLDDFRLSQIANAFLKINRRTHKKIMLVDRHTAFIGSHNMWEQSLSWYELGLHITPSYPDILKVFDYSWRRSRTFPELKLSEGRYKHYRDTEEDGNVYTLNVKRKQRVQQIKKLQTRISNAEHHVWVMTPYFVPPIRLVKAMCVAAQSGRDVRVVLPKKIDHPIMRLVAKYYYPRLLRCGVKIHHYTHRVLHAKAVMVDDYALLGSANLNHRSFLHDLEIMLAPSSPKTASQIRQAFFHAFEKSVCLSDYEDFKPKLWERMIGATLLLIKNWL